MPLDHLRKDTAQLVALFVEAVCYGIYLDTFVRTPESRWKRRSEIKTAHVIVTFTLFIVGTLNVVLGLVRAIQGFIYLEVTPIMFGSKWVNIVKPLTLNLQTIIADGVLIIRCWQVYGQRYIVVILPSILWLAGFGVTAWETFNEDNIPEYNFMLNVTYTIFWVITCILKLYTTVMVVVRIWRVDNATRSVQSSSEFSTPEDEVNQQTSLRKVLRIVIESGLIYTTVSFLALFSQVAMSNSVYISTAASVEHGAKRTADKARYTFDNEIQREHYYDKHTNMFSHRSEIRIQLQFKWFYLFDGGYSGQHIIRHSDVTYFTLSIIPSLP
ncbi:hypothetical protein CPB84DRAFT_1747446 [Gymnopilus junonius]|uniref:Uncharacterized protein n=1 Tax=Gymnopilus junonius TaxID=109634 RepID=A0A9P5NMQ3_GYMJU|nr:hypothetical protein CPB84DRAFT_1747446 [Gymnopilus junonius]